MPKRIISVFFAIILLFGCILASSIYQNISAQAVEEEHVHSQDEIESYDAPSVEYLNLYGLGVFHTDLPVLMIDTLSGQLTKENTIWGSIVWLDAQENQSIQAMPDYQEAITIHYRGASSYENFDKMQYRIKFYEEQGSTKKKDIEFLGMGANSEWVLHGPFLDKTLIRNKLAYDLGREIFYWAPDSRYVELFVDHNYQGVYLVVEPVTNGVSRLRLSEFGLLNGACGYLLSREREGSDEDPLNDYGKYMGYTRNDLFIQYPGKNNLTSSQREWIENDISKFEEALYSDSFADPEDGYAAYIDVDAFAAYVAFNELFMNNDAGDLSSYFYKDLAGQLEPAIWDYNNCIDNYQWFDEDYTKFFMEEASWFDRLFEDRSFVDKVIAHYKLLRETIFSDESLSDRIQTYQDELGDAIDRNFAVWGYTFDEALKSGSLNPASYEEAITQLEDGLKRRAAYLDDHFELLYENCIN